MIAIGIIAYLAAATALFAAAMESRLYGGWYAAATFLWVVTPLAVAVQLASK